MERRLLLLVLALMVGCSSSDSKLPKTYSATGTVTLNGKAVEGATVNFYPMEGTVSSIGSTDASGKYSLTTYRSNDGALPGQYKVSIVKYEGGAPPPSAAAAPSGQLPTADIEHATYVPPKENPTGAAQGSAGSSGPKSLLPAKYSNADSSGLRGLVTESNSNVNDFELK